MQDKHDFQMIPVLESPSLRSWVFPVNLNHPNLSALGLGLDLVRHNPETVTTQ